jgi:hypothetical protein
MDDRAARVRVSGPLAEHAEGFRAMLAGRGYAPSSAAGLLQVMAHLSRWLGQEDRRADDLDQPAVERPPTQASASMEPFCGFLQACLQATRSSWTQTAPYRGYMSTIMKTPRPGRPGRGRSEVRSCGCW